jgi:hypothetical protein
MISKILQILLVKLMKFNWFLNYHPIFSQRAWGDLVRQLLI